VSVSLIRKVDTSTVTITKVTNGSGVASFAEIGGFAGSLDDIEFTDQNKLVTFHVPVEFIDVNDIPRDSATACVIQFQRQLLVPNSYTVTIDGNELKDKVDP